MTLASLEANGDFRQWSLSIFGNAEVSREADNLGTAQLFEAVSARAGRLSSAAAENTKDLWRPLPTAGGKTDLSEKIDRFIESV